MPVPPPTFPSGTGPSDADSTAAKTCSGLTWKPLMSFKAPSQVSPTTGRLQSSGWVGWAAIRASWTTPTECVFVIATGVVSIPDSRTQCIPVSSPFPFRLW